MPWEEGICANLGQQNKLLRQCMNMKCYAVHTDTQADGALHSFASSDVTSLVLHLIGRRQQPRPGFDIFRGIFWADRSFSNKSSAWRTSNLGFHHLWIKNRINKRDRKKNFDSKFKLSFASKTSCAHVILCGQVVWEAILLTYANHIIHTIGIVLF